MLKIVTVLIWMVLYVNADEVEKFDLNLEKTIEMDFGMKMQDGEIVTTTDKVNSEDRTFEFHHELKPTDRIPVELNDIKTCSQETLTVYKENPMKENCEKILLKNGCEIEDFFNKRLQINKWKDCNPVF